MKKIPYAQVTIELDKLIFTNIYSHDEAEDRIDLIDAYLEATGWTWDEILEEMFRVETPAKFPATGNN